MDKNGLGPEWTFLEKACLCVAGKIEPQELQPLLERADFSYGSLLNQALRHKLQFVVAAVCAEPPLVSLVPAYWGVFLQLGMGANKRRNHLFAEEAGRVSQAMKDSGITLVARKGILLDATAYGSCGKRWMNDIDFMALPQDGKRIEQIMAKLGYQPGELDNSGQVLKAFDRKQELTYRMNPDHLPRFVRRANGDAGTHFAIDIATSFTWWSSDMEVSLEDAFANVESTEIKTADVILTGFLPEFHLLDIVMHLFREAYMETTISEGRDVFLSGFLDILMLCEIHRNRFGSGAFGRFCRNKGIVMPVAWVFSHLDKVFGLDLSGHMGVNGFASDDYLQSWRKSGGEIRNWKGNMRERLHAQDRAHFFTR